MIYYSNIPGGLGDDPVYYSPDNGRYQPKLTLADIRNFLGAVYCHPDGECVHGPKTWGRARLWAVMRGIPWRNAVSK